MGRVKWIWYLSPMQAAKVQTSLRISAVSPESSLLAHTSSESRGTFRQKARSLAPLNSWGCAVKICHDGMLEDTNSLDAAQIPKFSVALQDHTCLSVKGLVELVYWRWHLKSLYQDCPLSLKSHILWPFYESAEISLRLDILAYRNQQGQLSAYIHKTLKRTTEVTEHNSELSASQRLTY